MGQLTDPARKVLLPAPPTVSVVMAVRNEEAHLDATLRSVFSQDYAGRLEVVVADGRSDDATPTILASWAESGASIKVVENPGIGVATGLNKAIAAASGEILVRCDGHAELSSDYVKIAVQVLQETGAANVGGSQRAIGGSFFERAVAVAMTLPAVVGNAKFRHSKLPGPADTVYLGVFDRQPLEEVGLFDEDLLRNQDYELNHRLIEAGYTVWFDPRLAATYRPRSSIRSLWRQYLDYGRWKRVMTVRNPGSLSLRQLAPPLLIVGLGYSAIGGAIAAPFWWVPLLAYASVVALATAVGLYRSGDAAAWLLPVIMPTMQVAWGVGFLLLPVRRRGALPVEGSSKQGGHSTTA